MEYIKEVELSELKKSTRQSYGEILAELGEENTDLIVLDADLSCATKTEIFAKKFPNRFLDLGIAEADMISTASGLSISGKVPFVSTFAVFAAGRAYDQIRNSVCYPNINVKICATHAGATVGQDGATHQMIEDISIMRTVPNMMVFSPSDDTQTKWLIRELLKIKKPSYTRLCRLNVNNIYSYNQKFELGKGIQIGNGKDGTVFATGVTVQEAIKAQKMLKENNINIRVVDIFTIKPIDIELIIKSANETKKLISVEDHNVIGGLGSAISEVLTDKYPTKLIRLGIPDSFGKSGTSQELMEHFKITCNDIVEQFC